MDGDATPELQEQAELLARIERQDRTLAEQQRELVELRARLYQREQQLREARDVLALILRSRVYRSMRVLGRWGWLEHRIRQALR